MLRRAIAAVVQITATNDVIQNTKQCVELIERAASAGAQCVFLPEASDFIAESAVQAVSLTNESENFQKALESAAIRNKCWVFAGLHESHSNNVFLPPVASGVQDTSNQAKNRHFNAHIAIDNNGTVVSRYRKLHLFDIHIENKVRLMESDSTQQGKELVVARDTPIGNVGLGVCYDVRFPELSLLLANQMDAEILTYPSAFTFHTGSAHWEILLRARAIETQCYVIAAAQIGKHNATRESYGHAMIVDPWGTVIAQCPSSGPGFALAEIDLEYLRRIRKEMPVRQHRRADVYGQLKPVAWNGAQL